MKSLEDIIHEEVGSAVERIVRASRAMALAAFDEQFVRLKPQSVCPGLPSANVARPPVRKKKSRSGPKRRADEIAHLGERFLGVVRSNPGQPMVVLAPKVGATPTELQVPIKKLKAAKQIKTVGQRHLTRYFPVTDVAA